MRLKTKTCTHADAYTSILFNFCCCSFASCSCSCSLFGDAMRCARDALSISKNELNRTENAQKVVVIQFPTWKRRAHGLHGRGTEMPIAGTDEKYVSSFHHRCAVSHDARSKRTQLKGEEQKWNTTRAMSKRYTENVAFFRALILTIIAIEPFDICKAYAVAFFHTVCAAIYWHRHIHTNRHTHTPANSFRNE